MPRNLGNCAFFSNRPALASSGLTPQLAEKRVRQFAESLRLVASRATSEVKAAAAGDQATKFKLKLRQEGALRSKGVKLVSVRESEHAEACTRSPSNSRSLANTSEIERSG